MAQIRVVVSGSGYMGAEVLAACQREADLEPVGVLEKFVQSETVTLPDSGATIPVSDDPTALLSRLKPDVVIDFSNAAWTPLVADAALGNGARLVIGTTNLPEEFVGKLGDDCRRQRLGALLAPNFAIGAVLMLYLAKVASRYFDFAEIIEMHQEKKLDAPSGTAVATARAMLEARGKPFERTMPEKEPLSGARGAELGGVTIHSQRMPGFVAHQEVALGGLGQTLRIRHDSTGRESFIPGVLLATREVMNREELIVGLDRLIGL